MKRIAGFLFILFTSLHSAKREENVDPFPYSRFYLDGFGGMNIHNSYERDHIRFDYNIGYALGGACGYRFSRFYKIELEASYRKNAIDRIVIDGIDFPVLGSAHDVTILGNFLFEMPILHHSLIPYVGGGIGRRWSHQHAKPDPSWESQRAYDFGKYICRGYGFAGQAIVGFVFGIYQKVQLAVEYRFLDGPYMEGNNTVALNLKSYF